MKAAFPTDTEDGLKAEIVQHFGRSKNYTIVDTETKEATTLPNTSTHMGGTKTPPELLADAGIDVMVCAGLGRKAVQMFEELGITVYCNAQGTVEKGLSDMQEGRLEKATQEISCQGSKKGNCR